MSNRKANAHNYHRNKDGNNIGGKIGSKTIPNTEIEFEAVNKKAFLNKISELELKAYGFNIIVKPIVFESKTESGIIMIDSFTKRNPVSHELEEAVSSNGYAQFVEVIDAALSTDFKDGDILRIRPTQITAIIDPILKEAFGLNIGYIGTDAIYSVLSVKAPVDLPTIDTDK